MIDILRHFHQHACMCLQGYGRVLEQILFGGDQLTVERATHAQLQSKEQLKNCKELFSSLKIGMSVSPGVSIHMHNISDT